jgi:ornithine carbamoyltransferase
LPRHLLTGTELRPEELRRILDRAAGPQAAARASRALQGRTAALIFEQPSTRTRLSFEAGVVELGGIR